MNDPQQPESVWQERSAAFAGAILMQRSGNRLANAPAIPAPGGCDRADRVPQRGLMGFDHAGIQRTG